MLITASTSQWKFIDPLGTMTFFFNLTAGAPPYHLRKEAYHVRRRSKLSFTKVVP
jgi:hypothetical protein